MISAHGAMSLQPGNVVFYTDKDGVKSLCEVTDINFIEGSTVDVQELNGPIVAKGVHISQIEPLFNSRGGLATIIDEFEEG